MPTARKINDPTKKTTTTSPSVHLEGFADAIPSPMAITKKPSSPPPPKQQHQNETPAITMARNTSTSLINNALLSSYESQYATLQKERDELQLRLSSTTETVHSLKLENDALKSSAEEKCRSFEEKCKQLMGEVREEREKREEMEKKVRWGEERVDRLVGEGEMLRGEISRLTHTNEQHTNLITQIQTQNSFSTSQVIPLKLEITRLQQELDAVTSHSNAIENQLSSRNTSYAEARNEYSKELRLIKEQCDEKQWEIEKRDRELSSTRRHFELAQAELERMRSATHDKECRYIELRERMEQDLNKERELVSLKEQAMVLARDQRDVAMRELEDIRAAAKSAAERESRMEAEMAERLRTEVEEAVRIVKEEEEGKRVIMADRLRVAEEEKKRLEEDVLRESTPMKRRRMIEGGTLAITDGQDGPLSLTEVYTRLAETEDDLRAAQHDNKKLKIIIDRIHRDVAAKTPIFHQKQLELENALEELEESQERLDHARREVVDIRSDNQDLELKNQQLERECREIKRENHDLALQVQRLLQRGMAQGMEDDSITFDSIQTLQEQNQKLLRDHHSMLEKIEMLEGQINSNPDKIELDQLKEEVVSLREEREKQSKLVAGIVHQRDLYRALVAKNDAALVENETGNQQLALVDASADRLPMLEVKNRELVEETAKLRADLSSSKYEKESLESRLARLDAHADELTSSNEKMRGELTSANATIARLQADVSQYQGRCERLEAAQQFMKEEKEAEASRRNRMEELNSKLQMHLDGARATVAKHQQQIESASSKVKMLEVQIENAKASESRITAEANELRAEIARQGALLGSVQRIEASLVARQDGERGQLEHEVKRLTDKLSDEEAKYSENIQKLEGKIAEMEMSVKVVTEQREATAEKFMKANNEVSELKVRIHEVTTKLHTTEKELAAAKRKLGDVTIDTSAEEALEAQVNSLTSDLEATKADLEKAKERAANFQNIAKSSEDQLAEITAASTKYKTETEATLEKLMKSEKSHKEAVADLTKDLMEHRGEKDKAVNELQAKIESLTAQLTSARNDASEAISRMESLNSEMKSHQLNANSAQNNYERELALHAEARTALRDARSAAESEQSLRESAEANLESRKSEYEAKEAAWQSDKTKLEELIQQGKTRLDDLQRQNHLLHEQMTSLSENVEKFQADRASELVGNEKDDKQIKDLRELLQFKQSECVMLIADLASSKRSAERERTAAEMAKKSLDEARSELKVLRDSSKEGDSAKALPKDKNDLDYQLKTANDQLVLVRESNTMLREETQRLTKRLSEVEKESEELKTAASPNNEKLKQLEVEKAAIEAEKSSLSREVDAWKNRVHSLVSKFNQIDPEEHDRVVKEAASAKNLVTRLNKEISTQKSSIEAFKNALKAEKDKIAKSAQSNATTNKKIADAQALAKKSEEALKAKMAELESEKARVESFRNILTKMKRQIKEAKDAEGKANSNAAALQKQVEELNIKLSETPAAAAPKETPAEKNREGSQPATETKSDKTAPELAAKKKLKKRKGVPQKNAAFTESNAAPPLKKPVTVTQKEGTEAKAPVPAADKTNESLNETTTASSEPVPSQLSDTQEPPAAVAENETKPTEQQNKVVPPKKMIKLTKTATQAVQKVEKPKETSSEPVSSQLSGVQEPPAAVAENESKPTAQQNKVIPPKKMIKLTKTATQAVQKAEKPKEATPAASAAGKEEETKKKLLLLKKRKAEAQLKMQAAAKKKLDAEPASGKSTSDSDTPSTADATAPSSPKRPTTKSSTATSPKPAVASSSPKRLSPVPEKEVESKEQTAPPPAPSTFGSSTSVSGMGVPKAPVQSEPSCPKPSFFGSAFASPAPAVGFGSLAASGPPKTAPAAGFGSKTTEAKAGSPDKQHDTPSGAFLNLKPPGTTEKPSQFVFGKSANITLPVPSPSPFGVFSQKPQVTPFAAFNINPPFGSSGLEVLASAAEKNSPGTEAPGMETAKTEETAEEGEIEEETDQTEKDPVAKKA